MLCIKCKKEIAEGSEYCNWCGKKQKAERRKSRKRANSQGSVYKLTHKALNKPWVAVLPCRYGIDGSQKKTILGYYATKTEGLTALNDAIAKNSINININITVAETYKVWSDTHFRELSKSAISNYNASWNYLKELQNKKIKDVRTIDVQSIIDKVTADGKSRATCEKIKNLYSQLCQYAMSQDIISQNYAQFLVMPKTEKKEKEIFTLEEIKALIQNDDNDVSKIILILIFTGMRIGELFDITMDNVHLQEIPPHIIGGKKTKAGTNRIIPIHSLILDYIKYFYSKGNKYLVSNTIGGRMNERNFRDREYYPLLESLQISKKTPHSTRHTFATMLQASGAKPEDLIKVIGHADYSVTTDNYIHQDIKTLSEMIELFKV